MKCDVLWEKFDFVIKEFISCKNLALTSANILQENCLIIYSTIVKFLFVSLASVIDYSFRLVIGRDWSYCIMTVDICL